MVELSFLRRLRSRWRHGRLQNDRIRSGTHRILKCEPLEQRALLAGDWVEIRLETTDLGGMPIAQVDSGESFLLKGYVQDVRDEPTGVFAAFLDVTYNSSLVSVDGEIVHGGDYVNGKSGDTSTPGFLDEVGGFDGLTPLGGDEILLFTLAFQADTAGDVTFAGNSADLSNHTVLIFGSDDAVPVDQIIYSSTDLTVNITGDNTVSVGDRVWQDLNLDGLQNSGEPGTQDVQVEIFNVGAGGVIGDGDDFSAGSTTTDINGLYSFDNLPLGNYYLKFSDLPTHFQFTQQDTGDDDTLDSDVIPGSGRTNVLTLTAGETNTTIDAGLINLDAALKARFDIRVVLDPTSTDADGQVEVLPEDQTWIHEWHTYWIEVWVSTPEISNTGVTRAVINVDYDTTVFTATSVEPGAAFADGLTSSIHDTTANVTIGQVELDGIVTSNQQVGADQFVLLARIKMESTSADAGLSIDLDEPLPITSVSQPWVQFSGDGNASAQLDFATANLEISDPPSTDLYPMLYDLDDDGRIQFGDLAIFSNLFLKRTTDTPAAYKADFDLDDRVAFGDLALLSANFLKNRSSGNQVIMPLDFPTGFETFTASTASISSATISSATGPPSATASLLSADSLLVVNEPLLAADLLLMSAAWRDRSLSDGPEIGAATTGLSPEAPSPSPDDSPTNEILTDTSLLDALFSALGT